MGGFSTAISEITLVLFTTLAPSGALAYVLLNLPMVWGRVSEDEHRRLDKCSCLPLAITMVGLVASATHLGNPSNALYVFTGVGRSPLSTEVFWAVVFLAAAGVYWLYSFALAPRRKIQRVFLLFTDITALAFIVATAYAYNVETITSWSLFLVPISLLLNALAGGPPIALLGFTVAKCQFDLVSLARPLWWISFVALGANVVVYGVLISQLVVLGNSLFNLGEYIWVLAGALGFFTLAGGFALWVLRGAVISAEHWSLNSSILSSGLMLLGIFAMRFTFYMTHLTVGM